MAAEEWDCDAYGPEGVLVGALCFFAAANGERVCATRAECCDRMTAERQRVFNHIKEQAAAGDPTFMHLAEQFDSPDQLLGGGQAES